MAGSTLDKTEPNDVLGAPDPILVKCWSEVGAADSLVTAHNKKLKRQRAMAAASSDGEHMAAVICLSEPQCVDGSGAGGCYCQRLAFITFCTAWGMCCKLCSSLRTPHHSARVQGGEGGRGSHQL